MARNGLSRNGLWNMPVGWEELQCIYDHIGDRPTGSNLKRIANAKQFDSRKLERRETRKVGQREEKRTREAGTKMQCSTW